ncbi:MAG: SDR family oxidoreductase [Ginsengibacter sp.]
MTSYALVTGGSKGIGKAIAECLAKKKYNLLLVARSEEILRDVAEEINKEYNVDVKWLALDLSESTAASQVNNWITKNNFQVSILINNAGYGLWGNFHELPLEDQNNMLRLNVFTLVNLTYLMIPALMLQPKAYILNTGSLAGYQAMPTLNLYAASKALVNFFTRALRYELKDTSISVSLLSPGSVRTNFMDRAGLQHLQKTADKFSMDPEEIAAIAVKGMFHEKKEIMPGFVNRFTAGLVKLMPKSFIENVTASAYKKKP